MIIGTLHFNVCLLTLCSCNADSWRQQTRDTAQKPVLRCTEIIDQLRTHQLNDSQAKAVIAAASQTLTLIHGPPGTGKV